MEQLQQCAGEFISSKIVCPENQHIHIIKSELGVSACYDNKAQCCPHVLDCVVDAGEDRLDVIRGFCEGQQVCDDSLQTDRRGNMDCHGAMNVASDYETIYFKCESEYCDNIKSCLIGVTTL